NGDIGSRPRRSPSRISGGQLQPWPFLRPRVTGPGSESRAHRPEAERQATARVLRRGRGNSGQLLDHSRRPPRHLTGSYRLPPSALRAPVALGIVSPAHVRRVRAVRAGRARAARGTTSRPARTPHSHSYIDHGGAIPDRTAISGYTAS